MIANPQPRHATWVTNAVITDMQEWQSRPWMRVYPIVRIDAIVLKIRDGQAANQPVTWRW